ncbi:MAG: ATP-binding protein [Cyanobacteria bacterium P01_E01_bin.42]
MAIAHQIIPDKHSGAIACQSEIPRGTEFMIALPLS